MKYNDNNGLWSCVCSRLALAGMSLADAERALGLCGGMLEYMLENDVIPEDRLIKWLSMLTGRSRDYMIYGEPPLKVKVRRSVFVVRGAEFVKDYIEIEKVIRRMYIDRPANDSCTYIGVVVESDSMSRARIFKGDTVIIRKQIAAEDGDIVLASVRGKSVLRRFHVLNDVVWLEAEGLADDGPVQFSESLRSPRRDIRVYGKVVSVCRFMEDNAPATVL